MRCTVLVSCGVGLLLAFGTFCGGCSSNPPQAVRDDGRDAQAGGNGAFGDSPSPPGRHSDADERNGTGPAPDHSSDPDSK